ncbi:C-type lectin domain family 4 member G [Perognathus longimembris pacificus]|uniref:C-type lectin domain family 4 member G n=1 Tax=Perognathus longimembris pacificus TaxID=214514 RepID=UPI002018E185|nr:C-type lectin domain family 4 member G [Perognathus longimembris pacificus]
MDTIRYSKWCSGPKEVPRGRWGCWENFRQRLFFLALALLMATVLWAFILSVLMSKASTEHTVLLGHQDLLRMNASEQGVMLGALKEEVGTCKNCCSWTQVELHTALSKLRVLHAKMLSLVGNVNELQELVAQGLAKAGRDREDIRTELFRALEAAKLQNCSCNQCPSSWLPFQGSCYYFSEPKAAWEVAQSHCASQGAHLVTIRDLEEQDFLNKHTRGQGYWLGLRAVRHRGKIQGYKWLDGVSLTFSYWNTGEPNDSQSREDCVMMLHSGLWNDAPCDSEKDGWICKKRVNC